MKKTDMTREERLARNLIHAYGLEIEKRAYTWAVYHKDKSKWVYEFIDWNALLFGNQLRMSLNEFCELLNTLDEFNIRVLCFTSLDELDIHLTLSGNNPSDFEQP